MNTTPRVLVFSLMAVACDWSAITDPTPAFRMAPAAAGEHAHHKEQGVPHLWSVDGNAHDAAEWTNNLYLFSQFLFR